jgi:hypothetical protein
MKMFKKFLVPTSMALAILAGCGDTVYVVDDTSNTDESIVAEVEETTTTTKAPTPRPPSSTFPESTSSVYDPDSYDTAIWSQARDFWWMFTTEELLNMGLLICEELDAGSSLESVSQQLVDIMINTNTAYLAQGLAAMTAAALMYLCPEHQWQIDAI